MWCCYEVYENLYFTKKRIYPVAKQTENNKLTNLTININSQHIQHDEVGNMWNYIYNFISPETGRQQEWEKKHLNKQKLYRNWNYTEQNNLWL